MNRQEQVEREARVWGMHYERLQEAKRQQDAYLNERFQEYIFRTTRFKDETTHKGNI